MYGNRRATRDLDVGREGVKLCSVQRPRGQRESCNSAGWTLSCFAPVAGDVIPSYYSPVTYSLQYIIRSSYLPPSPTPSGASPQRFHSSQTRLGQEARWSGRLGRFVRAGLLARIHGRKD